MTSSEPSTDLPRVAVLVGSTRPGRKGEGVGAWVLERAAARDDARFELLDLASFGLPLLDEPTVPGAANREYEREATRAWSRAVDGFDAFVWVTPEYNHGVPAAMKNGLDVLYPEWNHKAVGFVSYGADGGVRAVEQWRGIVGNVHMVDVRGFVALSTFSDWADGAFAPAERRVGELDALLDQLVPMTRALRVLR